MLRNLVTAKFNGELAEKAHTMILTNWEYKPHATDPEKDYIILTFAHEKGEYKRNMFENDMTIMLSHLRRQLGRAEETITPNAFFDELIATKTAFTVWVSYPIVPTASGLRRVQNLHFLEPYAKMETESAVEAEADMEVPTR